MDRELEGRENPGNNIKEWTGCSMSTLVHVVEDTESCGGLSLLIASTTITPMTHGPSFGKDDEIILLFIKLLITF